VIYWVAIELMPTKKEVEETNALPKLIVPPVAVEARDDKDAAIKVAMNNEALKGVDQDKLTVLVRPF